MLWDASAIKTPVRFARCARRWGRISPPAWGTVRTGAPWVGFSRLQKPRDHVLGHVASPIVCETRFTSQIPGSSAAHVPCASFWPCASGRIVMLSDRYLKIRARAPTYDARIMIYGSQAACWCIKLIKLSSASCGMCFGNLSTCDLCVLSMYFSADCGKEQPRAVHEYGPKVLCDMPVYWAGVCSCHLVFSGACSCFELHSP